MKALLNEVTAKFNKFFFSWGDFYFSAGSFCCKQNHLKLSGIIYGNNLL